MDVLSKMLDKAAAARHFGYHPKCKTMGLTHLSFADDLMVLSDGKIRSIERIIKVFDEFAKWSGLRISLEKSTVYLAGLSATARNEVADRFPFSSGQLPVRYLGLPLITKRLSTTDCLPLLEQVRKRIGSWTSRFLSYAGRLNLISSVLWSICNFWLAAFRLPRKCIRELEKMCSAFLWSGTEMNSNKAKISWHMVCKPKDEGGLGLRSLKEANDVCCLKLVWKIVSHSNSLWVKWVDQHLLRNASFWEVKQTVSQGSWIWKKLLKYREVAKTLSKVEVGNGKQTSFWYDNWSDLGQLLERTGDRGLIDLGISRRMTVEEAWTNRRQRRHRNDVYNVIEDALKKSWDTRTETEDKVLWRGKSDVFRTTFSTRDTWHHTRSTSARVPWHKVIWFSHATPKYSFCSWLAAHGRLPTGDRMINWANGIATDCIFCQGTLETRDHLFFTCSFTSVIWVDLARGIFKTQYTSHWQSIIEAITNSQHHRVEWFLRRYVFQATIYIVWRERNGRRHGEPPNTASQLVGWIDKQIRNQLSSICLKGDKRYDGSLQVWFQSRS